MSKKVSDILPKTEILAQLAEEASELAQAALKLRRALDGTNPTPKSVAECEIGITKYKRWLSRLEAKENAKKKSVHGGTNLAVAVPFGGLHGRWTTSKRR